MPFLQDYECPKGHRFEHMADNRESAPVQLSCEVCLRIREEPDGSIAWVHFARPVISGRAAPVTIVKGNGDFAVREGERLHKRAAAHNQTREVRDEIRMNTEHALSRAGVDVGLLRRGGW